MTTPASVSSASLASSVTGNSIVTHSRRPSTTAALLKNPTSGEGHDHSDRYTKTYGSTVNNGESAVDINKPGAQVVDIVARHLIKSPNNLQLQSGDITRDLYKWSNEHPVGSPQHGQGGDFVQPMAQRRRSISFSGVSINSATNQSIMNNSHHDTNMELAPGSSMTHEEMRAPGGFRRSFLLQQHQKRYGNDAPPPNFFTRNFIEFLALYGHFAGENLEEDDDEETEDEEREHEAVPDEGVERDHQPHKASTFKAVLLLLKSFIGTGVLFLPKAFHNGGWGFSTICLLFCAIASFYCFISLISTKDKVGVNGYGDLGNRLLGPKMKFSILFSIALSQIGFSAAYIVFTATNLKVFCENVLGVTSLGLGTYIFLQAIIFIPLAFTRNITKLSGTILIADLFILLGLLYVYYYPAYYIVKHGIASDSMLFFNKTDFSLFIGTAIFTFEGIGLLIPIQESMQKPSHFQPCLSGVMCIITFIFISSALICYAAFGAKVETVILLNFPQDSPFTSSVQMLYALAILLSTPLQLFPAIRILENWTFPLTASGKHNPRIKWLKNYFRTAVVLMTSLLAWVGANDLTKFVSLVGSFACVPLIYIYPPMLHFAAFKGHPGSGLSMFSDILITVFGFIVMIYTTYQSISMWGN